MRVVAASLMSVLLLGSAPAYVSAQIRVVGWLGLSTPEQDAAGWDAFRQGLRDLGHEEGRTLVIEPRWARGDNARFPALVRDLLDRRPVVIFSPCGPPLRAIREVSPSVPVVSMCADPKNFLDEIATLNSPGGQTTGFTFLAPESAGKRLQLLKELLPNLSRVAALHYHGADWDTYWQEMERVAPQLGLTLSRVSVHRAEEIESAVAAVVRQRADALIVFPDALTFGARERIAALAIKHRLPTAFDVRGFVAAGGLLSYGPDVRDLLRRVAAGYVDKILKGVAPRNLPVQQPTRFELIVNLRTARTIGLSVPKSLLAQADEILE